MSCVNVAYVANGMKHKQLSTLIIIGLLFLSGLFIQNSSAQEESASTEEIQSATRFGLDVLSISGAFNTTYQYRSHDGEDDHDIYSYLSLRFKDIYKDHFDGAFSVYWHEDLDGKTSIRGSDSYDPFIDIDDAADVDFRFYTGYLDIKDVFFDETRLRVGRQFLEDIDYAHFDGASYLFSPVERLEINLFGGRPIAFYSGTSGDAFYGANVEYRFTEQTKGAARYYRYDDSRFHDDLAEVELWHLFTPEIQTHLEFSLLDAEPYLFKNEFYFAFPEYDFDVVTQFVHLFDKIDNHTINFNPYFPLLNGYEPFFYGSLLATKRITDYVSLNAGFDIRATRDELDPLEEFNNRDYIRGTVGIEIYPTSQLTISVNGEFWDVDSDDEFTGITGEVEYKPFREWTLTAGLDYGEYVQVYRDEYLFIFGQEELFRISPEVITYYARVKWQPYSRMFTSAYFEVEDSDFDEDEWYSLRWQLGVNF